MSGDAHEKAASMLGDMQGLDVARMRATFEAYLKSWKEGDAEARASLFDPAVILEDPVGTPPRRGIEAVRAFWAEAEAAGYAFEPRLELFIAAGHEALVRFEMRMMRAGAPTVDMTIHEVLAFDADCRIVSLRAFFSAESLRVVGEG